MNSLVHHDKARPSQPPYSSHRPRFAGWMFVAGIHVLMGWALVSGLARQAYEAVVLGPIETRIIERPQPPPPPPPEPLQAEPPKLQAPRPVFVPLPEIVVRAPIPPPVMQSPVVSTPPPRAELRAQRPMPPAPPTLAPPSPPAPVQAKAPPGPVRPEAICTRMGKPEPPTLNWVGTARYQATATVTSGRVAKVQIQNLGRNVERRAQRLLLRSIETALRDSYECPGNHVFVQEFVFRFG